MSNNMEAISKSCNADRVLMQIDIASANLKLSNEFYNKISNLYHNLRVDGWISDNTFRAAIMAGVLIYYSAVRYGENLTQRQIADALGITDESMRRVYRKHREFLSEVIL